jgi:hypothetical protein
MKAILNILTDILANAFAKIIYAVDYQAFTPPRNYRAKVVSL